MKRFFKNTLFSLNWLLVFCTFISYLSPFINPSKIWQLSLFGLAYPVLLLLNFIFIFFWVWRKNRRWLLSASCVLVGFNNLTGIVGLNFSGEEKETEQLSVMSFNLSELQGYQHGSKKKNESWLSQFEGFLEKNNISDVICLQETREFWMIPIFKNLFGHENYIKEKETIIFSRYKIENHGTVAFRNSHNSCVWADVKTPQGMVRFYSFHLQSAGIKLNMNISNSKQKRGDRKATWENLREALALYKRAKAKRAEQSQLISEHISKSPYPVIACGDLNDVPTSYVYRVLSNNLKDTFREKGRGFQFTYVNRIPGLRIDNIFVGPTVEVLSHEVPEVELSDHYPVLVRLRVDR